MNIDELIPLDLNFFGSEKDNILREETEKKEIKIPTFNNKSFLNDIDTIHKTENMEISKKKNIKGIK